MRYTSFGCINDDIRFVNYFELVAPVLLFCGLGRKFLKVYESGVCYFAQCYVDFSRNLWFQLLFSTLEFSWHCKCHPQFPPNVECKTKGYATLNHIVRL